MLIVWGSKIRRNYVGHAAGFCPCCRTVTRFATTRVRKVQHLYGISLGSGEPICDETKCVQCGAVDGFKPDVLHPELVIDPDLLSSALRTGPQSAEALTERLELESRLHNGQASRLEREQLIAEPFIRLNYMYNSRLRHGSQASISAVFQLLFLISIVGCALTWSDFFSSRALHKPIPWWAIGFTAATVVFGAIVLRRFFSDKRRAAATSVLSLLSTSLRSVNPSHDELVTALKSLKASGYGIADAVDPARLTKGAAGATFPDGV